MYFSFIVFSILYIYLKQNCLCQDLANQTLALQRAFSIYPAFLASNTGDGEAGVSYWLQSATSHVDGTESFTLDLQETHRLNSQGKNISVIRNKSCFDIYDENCIFWLKSGCKITPTFYEPYRHSTDGSSGGRIFRCVLLYICSMEFVYKHCF